KLEAEAKTEVEAVAIPAELVEAAEEVEEEVVAGVEAAVPVDLEEAVTIPVDLVLYLETVSTMRSSRILL
ncbi:MAG TPA: hypothetical protein DDW53_10980, partial [Lachnoclostridium sp.]|nr:hypothetical protein [Lachnoclostridium sp.]